MCQSLQAKRCELAVESLFKHYHWTSKHRNILENNDFFHIAYGTKVYFFWRNNRYPWWASPARPCQEVLWHVISQSVFMYKLEILTNLLVDLKVVVSSFKPKISAGFNVLAFVVETVFPLFSYIFAYSSEITEYLHKLIVSHEITL